MCVCVCVEAALGPVLRLRSNQGDSAFYDTRRNAGFEGVSTGWKGGREDSLSDCWNRRSGVSASGELDFPRVSVGTSVRSFVRLADWLSSWLAGWLAESAAAASKHVSPGGQ